MQRCLTVKGDKYMAGSKIGAAKAVQVIKDRYGKDFYARVGAIGGKSGKADGTIKGFGANIERARIAGAKGGRISKRGSK